MDAQNTFKLIRNDGKIIEPVFYKNNLDEVVEILNIKELKFEGMKVKDIKKTNIQKAVLKDKDKIYIQNQKSKITASLSKKHLNKIISTVFTKDKEGKYGYLKKEIVSNVDLIFYHAIPILKHSELKTQALYNNQIIHRFSILLNIGNIVFFVLITIKERVDYKEMRIDEFAIYDLYSEAKNKKSLDSPSTVSKRTFRSQYQTTNYIIYDLAKFVKSSIKHSNDDYINKKRIIK